MVLYKFDTSQSLCFDVFDVLSNGPFYNFIVL